MSGTILDAERLPLSAAAKRLGVHSSTVWRWATTGVRGRVLPTVEVGGRRFVLFDDLERFILTPAGGGGASPLTPAMRTRAANDAERELEALGL